MEAPAHPIRKKRRRIVTDVPIDYELSLRVQALESLIRSGSSMDADAASSAAMETIMHATRAANSGQQEAVNALAQLTSASSGLGIGGMSQDAQSSLLLDVLQQLSAASMGRPTEDDSPNHIEMRETWSSVPAAAPERTVTVDAAFSEDNAAAKVNASIPGFLDENGKAFIPPTVRHVDKILRAESMLLEATPIEGHAGFLDVGTRFAYGEDSAAYKNKRISAIQAVSLTGAIRLAATFVSRFPPSLTRSIYVPEPTAEEDQTALRDAGLDIKYYRYLDGKTGAVDWSALKDDLSAAPPRSAVLLHVSGSLPTGVELTAPQWRLMTALLQERQLIPLVVMAFQGLTSGDTNRDAQPVRFMVHESVPVVLAQSFEAMTGLYVDSPAIVSVPTRDTDDRDRVNSQLRAIARSMYTRPSPWGAKITHTLLSDAKLYPAWLNEIKAMSERLRSVRDKLYDRIVNRLKTPGSWMHIKRAGGMYCTTLLPPAQVEALAARRHVHILPDGCVSLACLDGPKIDALARGIDAVVREAIREAEEQAAQMAAMEAALEAARIQQAREDAEAEAAAAAAAEEAAREEDAAQLEASIRSAMEAQKREEEEERRREEETRLLEDQVRKAAERAEIERRAEQIIATI
ncbi:aspartate transaminase aat1 [Cryptotrichosporon argae]